MQSFAVGDRISEVVGWWWGRGREEDKRSYHFTLWDVLFLFSVKQPVVQKRNISMNDKDSNSNNDSNNDDDNDYKTHI